MNTQTSRSSIVEAVDEADSEADSDCLAVQVASKTRVYTRHFIRATLFVVIAYFLSLAPVEWLLSNDCVDGVYHWGELRIYSPILWLADNGPTPIADFIDWYAFLLSGTPFRTHGGVIWPQ